MEGPYPANSDVFQDGRELFASADHLGQILAPSSGSSSQLVRVHEGQTFFSVIHINDLLASFTTESLEIFERQDEAGHEHLALRLVDGQGDEVPTVAALRQGEWAVHSTMCSEDEQQSCDDVQDPSIGEDYVLVRHDTPFDVVDPPWHLDQRGNGRSPHEHDLNEDVDGFHEAPDNFVSSPQFQLSDDDIDCVDDESDFSVSSTVIPETPPESSEPTPCAESERGNNHFVLPHRASQYDDTTVRKLRELKLMDLVTLNRLLENRSPLALSPPAKTRDEFVHLCTLDNGKTFVVKMFRDLHAHSEDLELASLNDPELLDRQLTGYQRNELSRILVDIEKTACAQQLWSSAYLVPRVSRNDYNRIIPKPKDMIWKLYNEYDTMGDFISDVELLVKNVERFHGSDHTVTAAAKRTVQEILNRRDEAAAIGIQEHEETLFHGLVREVSLSEGTLLSFADWSPLDHVPRFVLPLGALHNVPSPAEPPRFYSGFVLMDVSSPRKALWLYHNGPESSYLVMLADDITHWKLNSAPGRTDGGLMKGHLADVRRSKLTKEYRESRINFPPGAVLFKRASKTQLAKAIRKGWGWEEPQEAQVTPRKRRGVMNEASSAARKNRRVYVWSSDEEEEWVPATEQRKSGKTVTPKGKQRRAKVPRTV
ncbi:transcription initiation at TATA-containing promoter protein [Gnomoniopsis smithogilvyi]|uniref:Transcription initiation at TATA-containing promoter protein n=1 Tax=Gnomoniopsis smithogilvyi TaxID=1191159 RepID=A0A9W9D006_9PEZI|nr:transcription initiation at TATA-containing promoter protein [Gnomoniopsis smithogilvyi]